MLRLSAGTLLAAGLWPGWLHADDAPESGEFSFIVINDLHYLDDKGDPWFELVVGMIKQMKQSPELCLLVGDLADIGTAGQLAAIRDHFKPLKLDVHVVIGNHDYIKNDSRATFDELYKDSINYRFDHRGWQFVALDSTDGWQVRGTKIQPATLQYLDDVVPKLDKEKPTVLFTHFPLGPDLRERPKNAEDVLNRFKQHNLQAVYNGHFHGFTEHQVRKAIVTTNKCCSFAKGNHDGTKEKGFFLCTASEGKIARKSFEVKSA